MILFYKNAKKFHKTFHKILAMNIFVKSMSSQYICINKLNKIFSPDATIQCAPKIEKNNILLCL